MIKRRETNKKRKKKSWELEGDKEETVKTKEQKERWEEKEKFKERKRKQERKESKIQISFFVITQCHVWKYLISKVDTITLKHTLIPQFTIKKKQNFFLAFQIFLPFPTCH